MNPPGVYTKHGATSRLEWTPHSRSTIRLRETGEAHDASGAFVAEAMPASTDGMPPADPATLEHFAARVEELVGTGLRLDRLIVAAGAASHTFTSGGECRAWTDANARCFVSVSRPDSALRVEVDLGASELDHVDLSPLVDAANALQNFGGDMTPAPLIRLKPAVSAALLRALATRLPESLSSRVIQTSHSDYPFDGCGRSVERHAGPPWPNTYRPSYRSAPTVTPFHVDLESARMPSGADAVAVALLEPFRLVGEHLVAVALCSRQATAYRCLLSHTSSEWLARIEGVGTDAIWFPFGAGSWGRDVSVAF